MEGRETDMRHRKPTPPGLSAPSRLLDHFGDKPVLWLRRHGRDAAILAAAAAMVLLADIAMSRHLQRLDSDAGFDVHHAFMDEPRP